MKKVIQAIMPVVRGFFLCAVFLQIALGTVYIGKNFMTVPQYRDTLIYLEMADRFVIDEYTGILYPLLVKLCYGIPFIPHQIPIYLIQIIMGVGSVYYAAHNWINQKLYALICALWINTIPFMAQAHVTILPHSLAMTCLILMVSQVLKGSIKRRALTFVEWAELFCSFVILAQLDRAYLIPGMLFVIWGAGLQFYNATHKFMMCGVSLLIGIGVLVINLGMYEVVQTPGYYGRIQRTGASVFFQRTGIETLNGKYRVYMPEEVQEAFSGEDLTDMSKFPYKIETEFGPTLEARYGREKAKELYIALGRLGLNTATKNNLSAAAVDVVNYAIPLGAHGIGLEGAQKGATSWNYQQFVRVAPTLAADYARICHFLWSVLLGASLLTCFILRIGRKKRTARVWIPACICILLYAVCFALGGTDSYDYKKALFPMVMSYMPICYMAFQYVFKEV